MSRVYPDAITYQVYISGAWVDLSDDVIRSDDCSYGIQGNGPLDRVAGAGSMTITLRNDMNCIGGVEGYYTPNKTGSLAGWQKGLPIKQTISYNSVLFVKRWYIGDIKLGSGLDKTVKLKCHDWMELAATQPIILPSLEFNKRIEEVVASVVGYMPIAPQSTTYGTGTSTFLTVYDTVRSSTTALSEITKATLSELGYVYLRRDSTTGERLVVEGRHTRTGHDEIISVPSTEESSLLLESSTGALTGTAMGVLGLTYS